MARRTSAERIALHKKIKRGTVGCAGGLALIGGVGYGLASCVNSALSTESTPRASASPSPTYPEREAFPTDGSTFDVTTTPEPQRSSVDDIKETPSDGWTSDPPKESASTKPSKSAEADKSDPCHWDVQNIRRAGKKVMIATVNGYEECVDGAMREAMVAYDKPSVESSHAFGVSNAQTVEVGCHVKDENVAGDWYLVRSNGIAGDNRAFIQGSVLGQPETPFCPPNYLDVAGNDSTR